MVYAALLLTLVTGCLLSGDALVRASGRPSLGDASSAECSSAPDAQVGAGDAAMTLDELAVQAERLLRGDDARLSSAKTFLVDLGAAAAEASSGGDAAGAQGETVAVAVSWGVEAGLMDAAAPVLEAYEDAGAVLVASGYLDLKGSVWAALVQSGSWVDVTTVIASGDDASSTVHIVRLHAPGT